MDFVTVMGHGFQSVNDYEPRGGGLGLGYVLGLAPSMLRGQSSPIWGGRGVKGVLPTPEHSQVGIVT